MKGYFLVGLLCSLISSTISFIMSCIIITAGRYDKNCEKDESELEEKMEEENER